MNKSKSFRTIGIGALLGFIVTYAYRLICWVLETLAEGLTDFSDLIRFKLLADLSEGATRWIESASNLDEKIGIAIAILYISFSYRNRKRNRF